MSLQDYETRYAEALEIVRGKIPRVTVGAPHTTPTGKRFVHVNGKPCDDEAIFTIAWSAETARDLVSQKRVLRR